MSARDVVIVGSGAGGGTLALALAEAGLSVTVLEKGPRYGLPELVPRDEIKVARRDFFVPLPSDEPHMVRRDDEPEFRPSSDGWISCCVGGGTVHMGGFYYRLNPIDFRSASEFGVPAGSTRVDFPIRYEDLAPWYDRVERLIGMSGRGDPHPFAGPRSGPYPLPPLKEHPLVVPFDAAAKKLGWTPFVTPRAVLSQPYDGRPACDYNGYCGSYGCETSAKSSVIFTVIPKAEATGHCTVIERAMVTEIVAREGRARAVRYLDASGAAQQIEARVVVVSCSAIESARLLLLSKSEAFPGGLANNQGLVGKNLCFSTFAQVEADFPLDQFEGSTSRLPFLGRSVQDFYARSRRMSLDKGGTLRFDLIHPNPIFRAERVARAGTKMLWGAPLVAALSHHFREVRTVEAEIFAEYLPSPETYVALDPEVRDRFGLPVAQIRVQHHPEDRARAAFLVERARALFTEMGAAAIRVPTPFGTTYVLQYGTCRFGKDPRSSVLDPFCRAHEVPNLYVVDGSFLPASGGVPNTLTIQANALRVGAHLVERFRRGEFD